jgi:hypothetical protein
MPYKIWNAAMPTTAAQASVTTGTAIKTMLQVATPATVQARILAWGFSTDDPPGADAVFELIQTDVAATVTAHAASGVQPLDPNAPAALFTLGTSATGFTATAEGTPTATRTFDAVSASSTSAEAAAAMNYFYQFMPDEQPLIPISKFIRIRATTPTTAVDMRCWVLVEQVG